MMANESRLFNAVEAGRIANLVEAKLKEKAIIHNLPTNSEGLPISLIQEALIGDVIPTPNRTCNVLTLQNNDYTVKTEICNGTTMSDWQEYADRLLFMALSCHWQGNDTAANQYFELATGMWDKIGINDTATKVDGFYTTYKLALLLYTSNVLGKRLAFEFELVMRIWSLQRETDGGIVTNYFANGTLFGDVNTETTSSVIISILSTQKPKMGTFAFYYPWYGTLDHSGYWRHWPPDNETRITHHPLSDFYDSNNETLIEVHIGMAREAGIDGFIVSWWGIDSFTDNATLHIKNVCEKNNFKFTIYYENTSSVDQTINDLVYILNNYANSSAWYKIDERPVIYVYGRARNQLNPQMYWKIDGNSAYWSLSEDVREPSRYGVFIIEPYRDGIGYVESVNPIFLQLNEAYTLKVGISDIRNDSEVWSDVGFRIKIRNETREKTLYDKTVNFTDGWHDLTFNISKYAGQNVYIRAESCDGGIINWSSEWAAVDYFYIENSKGEIVSPDPFFDNGWKTVVDELRERGFNPYVIMDFTGYYDRIQDFVDYFLNFTDGMHMYSPVDILPHLSQIFHVYNQTSNVAHLKNKSFVATVMPGYNDTNRPDYVVGRKNGAFYTLFWSIAKACFPDGYAITSFNEWHEGTEIEPSQEYGYQYINLTRAAQTMWTSPFNIEVISNSAISNFQIDVIQEMVSFNVSGLEGMAGFCNVTIPNIIVQELWEDNYMVLLNRELWPFKNWTDTINTYIHINYTHSEHEVEIIPEFPSATILTLFMVPSILAVVFAKRRFRARDGFRNFGRQVRCLRSMSDVRLLREYNGSEKLKSSEDVSRKLFSC